MNIALLTAGGIGQRMKQDIPKQFLSINDKPLIIYTLEAFQKHPEIDGIVVACLEGWQDVLSAYCKQFGITKLENIVLGGENGQSSIRNGLYDIKSRHDDDTIVLVHDGNRPMVCEEVISDCIKVCSLNGNAIAATPCTEAMLITNDGNASNDQVSRDILKRTQTPHASRLGKLMLAHEEALKQGITNSVATCTLFIELGEEVYFSQGSEKNFKLNTTEDIDIFKALLNTKKSDWLK